jgi:tRNA-2-methylthio-N6-dimethylallyladenosine synthase
MKTYHIWTVGCQVNVADSARLGAGLRRLGWQPTDRPQDADFIVVNTCAVRQNAEDRAAAKLANLRPLKERNADLKIAVMGCMVGPRDDELRKRFPYVDAFARPQQFDKVIGVLDVPDEDLGGEFWPALLPDTPAAVTAFVPVIEGCDKFCTYCIVPLRRGRERSRTIAEVLREVEAHVGRGVREVTLLGQTVEAYGKDQPPVRIGNADPTTDHADLSDLMRAIHDIAGLRRIRALTSYPPNMTDRILEGMAALPKVCESFSLPVQSGDDGVLSAMRRGYALAEFEERVAKVRALMPEVGISTDVIVGFPGESEAAFANTLALLERQRFDKVHVAAYSPRAGTYAGRKQPDDVPDEAKKERLHAVEELQARISAEINATQWDRTLAVLVEGRKAGEAAGVERLTGRTRSNKLVHFDAAIGQIAGGEVVEVHITRTGAWSLQGEAALATAGAAG